MREELQDLFYELHTSQRRAVVWEEVRTPRLRRLRDAVAAGLVPLFEDLGGGRAQLVHLSYQELSRWSAADPEVLKMQYSNALRRSEAPREEN